MKRRTNKGVLTKRSKFFWVFRIFFIPLMFVLLAGNTLKAQKATLIVQKSINNTPIEVATITVPVIYQESVEIFPNPERGVYSPI